MKLVHVGALYAALAFYAVGASAQERPPRVGEEFLVAGQEWRMVAVKFLQFDTREEMVLQKPHPVSEIFRTEGPTDGLTGSVMDVTPQRCVDRFPGLLTDPGIRERRVSGYDASVSGPQQYAIHTASLLDDLASGSLTISVNTSVSAYIDVGPRTCLRLFLQHTASFTHDISRENTVSSTEDIREGGIYDSLNLRKTKVEGLLDFVSIRRH